MWKTEFVGIHRNKDLHIIGKTLNYQLLMAWGLGYQLRTIVTVLRLAIVMYRHFWDNLIAMNTVCIVLDLCSLYHDGIMIIS